MNSGLVAQYNPFREPKWRAERANFLIKQRRQPKRDHDDYYIKEYRTFLMKLHRRGPAGEERTISEHPAVYYAHEFYYHPPDDEWRALLEARILSGESDDLIAAEFCTFSETIGFYEALFFDVRSRLSSRTYIIKTILGSELMRGDFDDETISATRRNSLYKLFAYFGGPVVLDIILAGLEKSTIPIDTEKASAWIDSAMRSGVRQKSTLAAHSFKVNKYNVMELLSMQQQFMQAESIDRAATGGAGVDYAQNVEEFLSLVTLKIGERAAEGKSEESLRFENTAVEPRAEELLQIGAGRVPELLETKIHEHTERVEEKSDA